MAGIFGMFDYTKPGPGVSKDEPQKYRFFVFFEILFRKFWKLIAMNDLYILCCLPVITIGPATAGYTYILRNFAREEHAFLWMDYRDTIEKNWKQAFFVSVINAGLGFFIYEATTFWYAQFEHSFIMVIPFAFCTCVMFIFIFMQYYIYIMLITFKLNLRQIYKNAFIFAFAGLPQNILITLILGLVGLLMYISLIIPLLFVALLLTIAVSFCGLVINFIAWPVIKKYMVDPYYEMHPDERSHPEDESEALFRDKGFEGKK